MHTHISPIEELQALELFGHNDQKLLPAFPCGWLSSQQWDIQVAAIFVVR